MSEKHIGHYVILAEIGHGAMGVVYKAWDTRLERYVALKRVDVRDTDSASRFELVLREARAASRIEHSNVATVYEVLESEQQAYLAMQFVDGPSLQQRLRTSTPGLPEALRLCREIASGLAAAHRSHVLHRDLKPANILLTRDGQAKIVDFGLARRTDQSSGDADAAGTLRYMAPEILEGKPPTTQSDVYGLGAVLYEVLAGRHPVQPRGDEGLVPVILHKLPIPLARLVPGVPEHTARAVDGMLVKSPHDRPRDAMAALDELEGVDATITLEQQTARRSPPHGQHGLESRAAEVPTTVREVASLSSGKARALVRAAVVVALLLTLIVVWQVLPSSSSAPRLYGRIVDERGSPLSNAHVTIDGYAFSERTASDGCFASALDDGRVGDDIVIRVALEGYLVETRKWVLGAEDSLRVALEPVR